MAGEPALYNVALNAFADRIKVQSCDIVVIKVEKDKKGSQTRTAEVKQRRYNRERYKSKRAYQKTYPDSKSFNDAELRRFSLTEEMKSVNQAIRKQGTEKNGVLFPEPLSRIYKKAVSRAKGAGKAFWVPNQFPGKNKAVVNMLWLTRTLERSNTDDELELYINGSLFFVDTVFSAFRDRSSMAARPKSTATGHKNYIRNPALPPVLIGDFTINVAFWNFFLKHRQLEKQKETIAY